MASSSTTGAETTDETLGQPVRQTTSYQDYEVRTMTLETRVLSGGGGGGETEHKVVAVQTDGDAPDKASGSSTAVSEGSSSDQENMSPSKAARHSRVMSGTELSPLKILTEQRSSSPESAGQRSPRKLSPEKRFPVKISTGGAPAQLPKPAAAAPRTIITATTATPTMLAQKEHALTMQEAMRQNEELKNAIAIFEDDDSTMSEVVDEATGRPEGIAAERAADTTASEADETAGPDDTMASTFSTFSAVPNLTMFAQLGQSPTRLASLGNAHSGGKREVSASRTAQPASGAENTTTNLLMDFTDSMRFPHKSPAKRSHPSPVRVSNGVGATPNRQLTTLIDFDIPPLPTPRSVPTISAREVESLKSSFLSEISSLKASLSGKEAEVQSLKTAVGDAEKRVGESMEQLREARAIKEQLATEKETWETRGREMESILRKIREEIVLSQREREDLERKLEESEKRREAAEIQYQESESKMAGMRAGKDSAGDKATSPGKLKDAAGGGSNRDVEVAVERVARELHALYKSKHETKVAALKKSYEARWEKKVRELEDRIEELAGDNDKLRARRDSAALANRLEAAAAATPAAEAEKLRAAAVRDSAAIKELNADVQRLEAVVGEVRRDNDELRRMLELERVEKGELVQLAEEMMSMQSFVGATPRAKQQQQVQPSQQPQQPPQQQRRQAEPPAAKTPRPSSYANRGSGLRAPGSAIRAPHERTKSGGALPRPGSLAGGRSGIMTSIERMGKYPGGRGE